MLKKLAFATMASCIALGAQANSTGSESFLFQVNNVISFGSDSGGYGTFSANAAGANFTDTITFTDLIANQWYNIKLNFSGFDLGTELVATLTGNDGAKTVSTFGDGEFDFGKLKTTSLSDGTGTFVLSIYAPNALSTSVYNGSFSAVATVPEPTAAAMLLAGFAVMGFIAMRRRRQD